MKVDAKRTEVKPSELRIALENAWGTTPPPNAVAVLLSQIGLETGWRSCFNFNLGNVKASTTAGYAYVTLPTFEYVEGKRINVDAPFRAFDTLDEGAAFYLDELRRRFARAWPAVLAGDVLDFAARLKAERYFTAPLASYQRGLAREFDAFGEPSLRAPGELADALEQLGYTGDDAVRRFQSAAGLTVDGDSGPMTRAAIRPRLLLSTDDDVAGPGEGCA